ncbi:ribonuclease III [Caulobacter vibrioides]|nr:ribonuclease III [Caulobacter vibrioides]
MSDAATPRLSLPYVAAGQAQKHITVNEGLARLDGLVQPCVVSRTIGAQPSSPADGAMWIRPATATGADWAAAPTHSLLRFEAGAWEAVAPAAGFTAWIADEGQVAVFTGSAWVALSSTFTGLTAARSPFGAEVRVEIREVEATLSGTSVTTAAVIPARSIVLGVSTRTSAAVTGAVSYSCGIAGETGKFGASLGVALNASNIGVVGPTAFYADTPLVITAAGGGFVSGKVRLSVQLLRFEAPAAV